MLKKQNYGIEIEMTGLTREAAAKALANYFGTNPRDKGGVYGTWEVPDTEGKTWKLVSDASIAQEKKTGRGKYEKVYHGKDYSVEMVSPVLTYEELPKLQEAVRQVRHAGAKVNSSCGIHIHIDGANHTPASCTRKRIYFLRLYKYGKAAYTIASKAAWTYSPRRGRRRT